MGIYVYEPRALNFLPDGVCQFPDLVHLLLDAGEPVAAYPTDVEWYDIGTVAEHERAVQRIQRVAGEPGGRGASASGQQGTHGRLAASRHTAVRSDPPPGLSPRPAPSQCAT